jgi:hypothetical protein
MKRLNATFDIENDLAEYKLREVLEGIGAKHVKTLPNTEHLKDNTHYKALYKAERKAKELKSIFINNNRA